MLINEILLHNIILAEINQNVKFNPTKANVYNTFNSLNTRCFNDSLPMCDIEMITDRKYLGYFHYDGVNGNQLINPKISINQAYQYTMSEFESVVAHEMIHYYLAYNGQDMSCDHSNYFHTLASQINSQLGLNINDTVDVTNMAYNNQQVQISSQLLGYMNSYLNTLKQYLGGIKNESKGKNGTLAQFYTNLYQFTQNIINSLQRCIKKRSLNEDIGQTAIQGVQTLIPLQPVNDLINGYEEYSNKTKNWMTDGRMDNNYSQYGKNGANNSNNNTSGLIYLLYNVYPKIKTQYQKCSMGYNSLIVTNEFRILDDLKSKIDAETNNAQGGNP